MDIVGEDCHDEEGQKRIEELFEEYKALHAEKYPSSSVDFNKLNLTLRVKSSSRRIGRGGHAIVYRGTFDDICLVGVKIMNLPIYNRHPTTEKLYSKVVRRFFRELDCWHGLNHINIAQLLGFILLDGDIGFVSHWHQGGNLAEYIVNYPDAGRADLMLDVAEGVQYLHTQSEQLLHGDLKAENVLVTERGIACLADFGISKRISDLSRRTGFSSTNKWAAGTSHMMAPELFDADVPELVDEDAPITCASDVYSFGGVLLQISCSGKYPYHNMGYEKMRDAKALGKLPDRLLYQELDSHDRLWDLIMICIAKNPQDRPGLTSIVQQLYEMYSLSPRVDQLIACRPKLIRAIELATEIRLPTTIPEELPSPYEVDIDGIPLEPNKQEDILSPQLLDTRRPYSANTEPGAWPSVPSPHSSESYGRHLAISSLFIVVSPMNRPYDSPSFIIESRRDPKRTKNIAELFAYSRLAHARLDRPLLHGSAIPKFHHIDHGIGSGEPQYEVWVEYRDDEYRAPDQRFQDVWDGWDQLSRKILDYLTSKSVKS